MKTQRAPLLLLALALAACSSSDASQGKNSPGAGDGDSDATDAGTGNDASGDGDGDGDNNKPDGGAVASPEVCDGIDNDLDGQIDNIDVEGDGVCDCLNIATIGQIGPWSTGGNVFKTWLDERSPVPAAELGNQVLTDELLRPYQVIVLLYVGEDTFSGNGITLTKHHTFTADEAAALERWVQNGGGVMATIGYHDEKSEVVNANRLLSPLGMAYSTTKTDTQGFVQSWTEHPLTADVKKIRTDNGVQPDGENGTTLARDGQGRVAMQAGQVGDGRVVVWGDEWITYDSEWQDTSDQQVDRLWLNILKWLSPPKTCQVALPPVIIQ